VCAPAAFIACAGAPEPLEVGEAVARVSSCAARILAVVAAYRTPTTGRPIAIRVGVHVGRVLGAVVGNTLVCGSQRGLDRGVSAGTQRGEAWF
jgi:class 3 adenylate cyclase